MNIPKSIKIGGHEYKVIFPYVFTERVDRCGDCNGETKVMRIAQKVNEELRSDSTIFVTFIHECLHAIDNLTGHEMFRGDGGESKIEALSEGIYQVLVDNGYLNNAE